MSNYLINFSPSVSHSKSICHKWSFHLFFLALFSLIQIPNSMGLSNETPASISSTANYSGQLLLTNIQLKSEDETHYIALLTATNLSGQTLQFGTGEAPDVHIKFEESFSRHPLNPYKEEIIEALLDNNFQIPSKKTARGIELMLEKTKPLGEKYVGQQYNSQLFKIKRKKISTSKRKIEKPIIEESIDKNVDPVIEIAEQEKPISQKKEKKSIRLNDKKEIQKEVVIDETEIITKDEEIVMKTEVMDKEIALTPIDDPLKEKIEPKSKKEKKSFIKLSKRKKVTQEEKKSVSFTSNIENDSEEVEEFYYNESACADIIIDSLSVIKNQKNKWLTVQYTITNKGTKSADLYGNPGDDADNLAIKVFLASSENLTRGSIPVGGSFIKNGVDDGILLPNQSHTGTFKIDIRTKTSFTPFLIFSADHFNVMVECDKTNNKNHLFVQ